LSTFSCYSLLTAKWA